MKLNVPFFEICDVPVDIVNNIVNNIEEQDWFVDDYRASFSNLQESNSIPIMHTPLCAMYSDDRPIDAIAEQSGYKKFYPLIKPVLDILSDHYQFNKYACFLARLKAGNSIGMHVDSGNFLTKCRRIHLPLVTDEKVEYIINGVSYFWKKGTLFEFDNTLLHGVKNNSTIHRIHLVINLYNV